MQHLHPVADLFVASAPPVSSALDSAAAPAGDARWTHSTSFSRDLRPPPRAAFRQRVKIDAVDTQRLLLIISTDATRLIELSRSAARERNAAA